MEALAVTLAIFDLDNTLIGGDSDNLWGEFVCEQGLVDSADFAQRNAQFYADYQAGTLDIDASEKAARFVRTCDAFNVPVLTLVAPLANTGWASPAVSKAYTLPTESVANSMLR